MVLATGIAKNSEGPDRQELWCSVERTLWSKMSPIAVRPRWATFRAAMGELATTKLLSGISEFLAISGGKSLGGEEHEHVKKRGQSL